MTSRSLVMNDLSGAEGQFQICCGHICSLIRSLTAPLGDNTEVYMLARKVVVIHFSNETFPASASACALWTLAWDCCRLFHLTCSALLFLNVCDTAQGSNQQLFPYLALSRFGREGGRDAFRGYCPQVAVPVYHASIRNHVQQLLLLVMYSASLRGVCMCLHFQGDLRGYLAQQDWKFRNADSLELQRMGCEIAAGVTHLHKHNFLHRYDTSAATRSTLQLLYCQETCV